MDDIRGNLNVAKKLVSSIHSLVGPTKSVKCVVDSDGNFELTSVGLKYLRAIDCKHWVYGVVYDQCMAFDKKYGFGSETFLYFVGSWCNCVLTLVDMEIPTDIISYAILELIERTIKLLAEIHAVKIEKLSDVLRMCNKGQRTCPNSEKSLLPKTYVGMELPETQSKVDRSLLFSTSVNNRISIVRTSSGRGYNKSSPRSLQLPKLSRYSRHIMNETKEELRSIELENMKKSVQKLCSVLSGVDDEHICALISELYLCKCQYLESQPDPVLLDFYVDPDRILIETCIGSNSVKSCVYQGILVECNEWSLYDLLYKFDGGIHNIVLVNMIAYGDILPDKNQLSVREVVTNPSHNFPTKSSNYIHKMKKMNVSMILYRGNIETVNISEYYVHGIAVISLKDFGLMYKLSMMLSCDIVYGLDNVDQDDVRSVRVELIHQFESKKVDPLKLKYREKNRFMYFLIQRANAEVEHSYYSILLMSRTLELSNLEIEKFLSALYRVQSSIKFKLLVQASGYAEEMFIECLSKVLGENVDGKSKKVYHFPKWIGNDIDLYSGVIAKEIIRVFMSYNSLHSSSLSNVSTFDSYAYRSDVWRDSLMCVIDLINTREINLYF